MTATAVAQVGVPETLPAILGTILVATVFYGLTAHVAARYVLGDVRIEQGLLVGAVPATILIVGIQLLGTGTGIVAAVALALVGDYVAIYRVYDPGRLLAGVVTVVHYAVSVLLGTVLVSLLG